LAGHHWGGHVVSLRHEEHCECFKGSIQRVLVQADTKQGAPFLVWLCRDKTSLFFCDGSIFVLDPPDSLAFHSAKPTQTFVPEGTQSVVFVDKYNPTAIA
jgi:hypothetical protein